MIAGEWRRVRQELKRRLGGDRWIEGAFPAVAPASPGEVAALLRCYPGPVMAVGSGSSFPDDFKPQPDVLVVLTGNLKAEFDISVKDQVITVAAGWQASEVNSRLRESGFVVPALACFQKGTVGGRLAAIPSRPAAGSSCGWMQSLLGLEVVLPEGEHIRLGGRCIKDVAGYDLRHLFTGSRGAAGVIVCAVFRCLPEGSFRPSDSEVLPTAADYASEWRQLFDPNGRMRSGA